MELREVGIEALKYTATGAAGFALGALMGKVFEASPLVAGAINAVAAVAGRALDQLAKKIAESRDWNLSTFKIAKTLGQGLLAVATMTAFVVLGVLGSKGAILFGLSAAIMFGINLGVGVYLRQSEEDKSINDFVMKDDTPIHIMWAYA